MTVERETRILVAMDCSEQAQATARYLGEVLAGSKAKVVLFHVLAKLPDSYYDISDLATFQSKIREIATWDWGEANKVHLSMEKARNTMVDAGLSAEAVTIDVHDRAEGIARDILKECQKGYTAVAIGRRGASILKDALLGSTANKLVSSLHHLPVWVLGGKPETKGYVVGIDGSAGSMRAVEHLAAMIGHKKEAKVKLVNVVRRLGIQADLNDPSIPSPETEEAWEKAAQTAAGPNLAKAEKILEQAGMDKARIDCKVITGALSRAESLVEEATQAGFGTLVMGRRGLTKIEAFIMGRVTGKILSLTKDKAVWIVH
ncbi:MAG: universal stress protein [Proteobacteria bacterium]|nr:universal stress protein [Pseudomonadota bacterium]MBU4382236.1 universal stress protein [Pseudomonadota bacterium]MBU4605286.1 universal stress protein [Pseudomonadota bacterium]MCG2765902.1 universal stress protein [Desulfarculaceae bacterium]